MEKTKSQNQNLLLNKNKKIKKHKNKKTHQLAMIQKMKKKPQAAKPQAAKTLAQTIINNLRKKRKKAKIVLNVMKAQKLIVTKLQNQK